MSEMDQMRWHQLSVREVMARLDTGTAGLSEVEAARRLERFGPNELAMEKQVLPLVILLRQIQSPLIYLLIVAGAVTWLVGEYVDSVIIFGVVVLNSAVGFVQEYKAEQAMRALASLVAPKARVLREGQEREIDSREVVPGDVVLLESGARVPADLRLFRSLELRADESLLTGESVPVAKTIEPVPDPNAPLGDRANTAFAGSSIVWGRGAGVAVATATQTAVGRIAVDMREVGEGKSPLQVRLERLARLIALFVVAMTALVFFLGLATGVDMVDILLTAISTAVATIPEGLPIVVTVALAAGVMRMAGRRAIVRKLPVVETLGSCTTICSDKTGTLTGNEMTVTKVLAGRKEYEVTGVGYGPKGEIRLAGRQVSLNEHPSLELALRIGLLCNESAVYEEHGRYRADGDPTEAALIVAAMKGGLHRESELEAYPILDQIPFESERQYMASLHGHNGERLIFVKGAPERVLEFCEAIYAEGTAPLDRQSVLEESYRLATDGLRVLAVAYRPARPDTDDVDHRDVEGGLIFVGLQGMIDPPRPEAIAAVADCQRAGIRVVMITGDHKVTAEAIGRQMGIIPDSRYESVTGRELEAMDDEELFERVKRIPVFARAAPEHKLRIVRQLRRHGEVVAVTGDGVNDAPALKQADIGVAMGIAGTDVSREAADMVLADDNFATIYRAVEEGRVVFENIRKVIAYLFPTGMGLLLTVVSSMLLGLPLPFLPAQAIWINLVTNTMQDVGIAFEPAEEDVGRRPPRDPREEVLTRQMIERMVLVGAIITIGTLAVYVWHLTLDTGLEYARTAAMTTMVLFQNFHLINSRSLTRSFVRINPLSNRFLVVTFATALVLHHLLALYWEPLQSVLRTEPLSSETWLVIIPVAATVLLAVELDKGIRRLWGARRSKHS